MEATGLYDLAYSRLNAGNVKFAHDLLMEAIQLCVQVYGPMHTDIANCYRLVLMIYYYYYYYYYYYQIISSHSSYDGRTINGMM